MPVFFAAGFGIVTALEGGDGAAETRAASAARTTVAAAASTTADTVAPPAPPTTAADQATTVDTQALVTTAPAETDEQRPPADPGAIEIDYGRWQGMFRLTDAKLVPTLQASTVGGQFTYLGGAGCAVRNVVVDGRFYDREDVPVGLARWESRWVTGEAGLARRKPVPFGAYGSVLHLATSAELELVRVVCS